MKPTSSYRDLIARIPLGYSEGTYRGSRYGISKTEFNGGRSLKIFARELKGTDIVSLNYYRTSTSDLLKPCEMPEQEVIDFLTNVELQSKTIAAKSSSISE